MNPGPENHAKRTLVAVTMSVDEPFGAETLRQLPPAFWNALQIEVVVVDDDSPAAAAQAVRHWAEQARRDRFKLLRSDASLGYGGRRKLACRLALDGGFDHILIVPASGVHHPEAISQLHAQILRGEADLLVAPSAALGFLARLLDRFQRRITRIPAAGQAGGLRAVSAALLKRIPFEVADNGRIFDTQMLLQAVYAGAAVALAAPAPPSPNKPARSARDAFASLLAAVQFKFHQMGMVCALTYRHLEPFRYRDKAAMLYSSHAMALDLVRARRPRTLLDIGCGPGHIASRCRDLGAVVTGVDAFLPHPGTMDHFHRTDLESEPLPVNPFDFDMVLLMDVIEHFEDPERFLLDLRGKSHRPGHPPPVIVISTPNIAFFSIRLNLLMGRFNYAERGILDVSHKRLFTRSSLLSAIRVCGYTVESIKPVPAPFEAVIPNRLGTLLARVAAALAWLMPGLFAFQFLVVCRPLPSVASLLAQATSHYEAGKGE